jgi:hypothetical protein
MTNQLNDFIARHKSEKFATEAGLAMHIKLQHVCLGDNPCGDKDLIDKIISCGDKLKYFFTDNSKTEVPIAGMLDGRFISRRLDRLVVDDTTKTVRVLDYKTDVDTEKFRAKYVAQLREYVQLLKQIYPDYKISAHILWLHDWALEDIINAKEKK